MCTCVPREHRYCSETNCHQSHIIRIYIGVLFVKFFVILFRIGTWFLGKYLKNLTDILSKEYILFANIFCTAKYIITLLCVN